MSNHQGSVEGHTAGPWFADFHNESREGGRTYVYIGAGGIVPICAVVSGAEGYGVGEGRANARLIAAAPETNRAAREALDLIIAHFGPADGDTANKVAWSDEDARMVAKQLEAALSKATPNE